MKAKILLLIIFSGLILCCRTKTKITTAHKENKKETEKVKVDSLSVHSLESIQNTSTDTLLKEKKNEISGDVLITGKSDLSNPFVFHNVVGNDTIQSISIMGNAEYSISNHYAKTDHKKSEVTKEESTKIIQDSAQKTVLKEEIKESTSKVSNETKKIKVTGLEVAAWIFLTVIGITLILIFFTYKYFKA
ncbi:hypothetical protein J3D55_003398 [Chryseobacterium ginsenosidimutans]|uniref:hypothetical protein n=1 Tax=Chryseobacterium ginsenosidimutans TaxID=687846 RepID=UPI002168ABD3|nr:hypothetical protein [Chryseobacterium ginsenosidimutans]MCS3870482.1 hypothetical protein [Chryseobacterium ginsenosidimutans]